MISSVTVPNSLPIGSPSSRATMLMAIGTGWPARNERTMMSMASGNCAANFFCRRERRNLSTMKGSTKPLNSAANDGVQQAPFEHHGGGERGDHADDDEQDQPAETDGQAGLQHELIEVDERQLVFAAAGQPALAPQLHQHAFAVRLARPSP